MIGLHYKYVGPPYCLAEMYAGHVSFSPWWVMLIMRRAPY